MIIRKANYNDINILNNFLTLLIRDERQYDPGISEHFVVTNMYENFIEDSDKLILVAEIKNQIVGYLYGQLIPTDATYKYLVAKLDALYVDNQFRNRKVATSLIAAFKKWAILKNVNKIEVNVLSGNKKAKSLYAKAQFKLEKEILVIDNLKN